MAAGCAPQSSEVTGGVLQSPVVRRGSKLCFLAGWYHQLDYAVGQGCGLGSTIAPGLAGNRAASQPDSTACWTSCSGGMWTDLTGWIGPSLCSVIWWGPQAVPKFISATGWDLHLLLACAYLFIKFPVQTL